MMGVCPSTGGHSNGSVAWTQWGRAGERHPHALHTWARSCTRCVGQMWLGGTCLGCVPFLIPTWQKQMTPSPPGTEARSPVVSFPGTMGSGLRISTCTALVRLPQAQALKVKPGRFWILLRALVPGCEPSSGGWEGLGVGRGGSGTAVKESLIPVSICGSSSVSSRGHARCRVG